MKIRRIMKILSVNLLILLFLITIIELVFGGWIINRNNINNLNILHSKTIQYNVQGLYDENTKYIKYSRDKYGLRGSASNHPENIDILTIGGSTTDQRYIADGKTWQDVLENNLRNKGHSITVSNAGIDGQSTFGHIKNFQFWFPNIPNLEPKFIVYFIGLNDLFIKEEKRSDYFLSSRSDTKYLSACYNLYRKIKGIYIVKKEKIGHSKVDYGKYKYTNKPLNEHYVYSEMLGHRLIDYRKRLTLLVELSSKMGATPIFVTQPSRMYKFDKNGNIQGISEKKEYEKYEINGLDYYYLLNEMNNTIRLVCKEHQLLMIDMTNLDIWEDTDFYDFAHMSPHGANKFGVELSKNIMEIL